MHHRRPQEHHHRRLEQHEKTKHVGEPLYGVEGDGRKTDERRKRNQT
jgi:hypothetical protein